MVLDSLNVYQIITREVILSYVHLAGLVQINVNPCLDWEPRAFIYINNAKRFDPMD